MVIPQGFGGACGAVRKYIVNVFGSFDKKSNFWLLSLICDEKY